MVLEQLHLATIGVPAMENEHIGSPISDIFDMNRSFARGRNEDADSDDRLIVTKLVFGQHQGWLDKKVWDWINARL